MTTIIAYSDDNGVYMASDTLVTIANREVVSLKYQKIGVFGPWILALSGPTTFVYQLHRPNNAERLSVCKTIHDLCDVVSEEIPKSRGFQQAGSRERDDVYGPPTSFLVGRGTSLWFVSCSFDPILIENGRAYSIGSGGEYALGAFEALGLYGSWENEPPVLSKLSLSVLAACVYDTGSGGGVDVCSSRVGSTPTLTRGYVVP